MLRRRTGDGVKAMLDQLVGQLLESHMRHAEKAVAPAVAPEKVGGPNMK